jgi:Protein of unknown function DUF262
MSLGSKIIYRQLFDRHRHVRIPMIQRDYAQGRPAEIEVREEFLDTLIEALRKPVNDTALPLNLDFIYGSVEGVDETRFFPLDGQQRLTTLFLLHWYLAWRDEQWDLYKQLFQTDEGSRFSYSVRPSSNEFFDELVSYYPDSRPEDVPNLAKLIADQPWYFRSWRLDPTIQSVLCMLDAIHKRFASSTGLFGRLVDEVQPAITFQLLNLENFGLSDDLYIKMNARGKPLTAFETFKARFEQELTTQFDGVTFTIKKEDFSVSDYVALKLDTTWADLFWRLRDKKSNLYDEALMNVFRAVALVTRNPRNSWRYLEDVNLLRNNSKEASNTDFHSRGWLDKSFTLAIIYLLDAWSRESGKVSTLLPDSRYFDEISLFKKIVSNGANLSSMEIVQFAAYVLFINKYQGKVNALMFQEWMRIVYNLSVNTEYNRPDDLRRSIAGLHALLHHADDVLKHFAEFTTPATGFYEQQTAEEKLKAELILAHIAWRGLIDQAEKHGYFQGQIEFLLDFSGASKSAGDEGITSFTDETHLILQEKFKDFLQKAEAMFSSKGLTYLPQYRWERGLLCIGNYLLPSGRNHSFLVNSQTEPTSWKRLLRGTGTGTSSARNVLRELWERFDGIENLSTQLDEIINGSENLEPWRESFVRTPVAIDYCTRRLIRKEDSNTVFLLQTTRMSGTHAELFTYCLYVNTITALNKVGCLKPLRFLCYIPVAGIEIEPGICLEFLYGNKTLRFDIEFHHGQFALYISSDLVKSYPVIEETLLISLGFEEKGSRYYKWSKPNLIESSVRDLSEKLAAVTVSELENDGEI